MTLLRRWGSHGAALLLSAAACRGGTDPDEGGNPPPTFTVTAVNPAASTVSDPWPAVSLTLSGAVEPGTVTAQTLRLLDGVLALPTRISVSSTGTSLTLEAPMLPGRSYRVEAAAGLSSSTGLPLTPFQATFSTRSLNGVGQQQGQFVRQLLVQDGTGSLHLLTHDATAGLVYATCAVACGTTSGWQSVALGTAPDFMLDIGFSVASDGRLHATFHEAYGLRYATCGAGCTAASNWQMLTLDTDARAGMWSRIEVDQAGTAHVIQSNWTDGIMRYHQCALDCGTPSGWANADLPSPSLDMQDVTLAVASGQVHAIYRGQGPGGHTRNYATCTTECLTTNGWTVGTISTTAVAGLGSALAIGSGGTLIHAYTEGPSGLRLATCTAGCNTAAAWSAITLDPAGNSLLVDLSIRGGRTVLAYGVDGNLRLGACADNCISAANWKTGVVSSSGAPAPSVLLDSSLQPRIATGQSGGRYIE